MSELKARNGSQLKSFVGSQLRVFGGGSFKIITWSDLLEISITAPSTWELRTQPAPGTLIDSFDPTVTIFTEGMRFFLARFFETGLLDGNLYLSPILTDGSFTGFGTEDTFVGRSPTNPFINGWKYGPATYQLIVSGGDFPLASGTNPYTSATGVTRRDAQLGGGGTIFSGFPGAILAIASNNSFPSRLIAGFDFGKTLSTDTSADDLVYEITITLNQISGGFTHIGAQRLLDLTLQGGLTPSNNPIVRLAESPATFNPTDTLVSHPGWSQLGSASIQINPIFSGAEPLKARITTELGGGPIIEPNINGVIDGAYITTDEPITELSQGNNVDEGQVNVKTNTRVEVKYSAEITRA